jgi:hypothetical protein
MVAIISFFVFFSVIVPFILYTLSGWGFFLFITLLCASLWVLAGIFWLLAWGVAYSYVFLKDLFQKHT